MKLIYETCLMFHSQPSRQNLYMTYHKNLYSQCFRGNVPDLGTMLHRLNYINIKKQLYLKLNNYGNNGKRKMWLSCDSVYCTCLV
jgi:hypothetical protein